MADFRYTGYHLGDVWTQLVAWRDLLGLDEVPTGPYGHSVTLHRAGVEYRAVLLTRSSDWYRYSLNCVTFLHGLTCIVCGTHDSCIERVPVLALDALRWYAPKEMRVKSLEPTTKRTSNGRPDDAFEHQRKSHYGHAMLIGALMCGRRDALARLKTLPPRTQRRIEAEVCRLHCRRPGHPLKIWPVYPHALIADVQGDNPSFVVPHPESGGENDVH